MTYKYSETTLDNGLRIVAESSPEAATAAIGFFVKTGARDERSTLMGVSHFLEHMMFKGTETMSAEEVDIAFDNLGAQHNAFTSGEMTAFWGAGLPDVIEDVHDILANILRPSLRQEDFDAEKSVILEEIAMYDDQPFWVLYESALEFYYGNNTLGHRVLGTPETINKMTRDELANYFVQQYSADNTIVAITGNVEIDSMVDRIQERCGSWERTGVTRTYDSITRNGGKFQKEIDELQQCYLMMMMPSASFQDSKRHAVGALGSILGGGDCSRLHWALVDKGIAEAASASVDAHDKYGEQLAWAICQTADADNVSEIMISEMEKLCKTLTQNDLSRVVAKAATAAAIGSEKPVGRMQRLGGMLTTCGEYISLEEELNSIESLTIDDLVVSAEAYPWSPILKASTAG